MTIEIRGAASMRRRLEAIGRRFPQQVERALREEAEEVMTKSKEFFVPIDLANLKDTGKVDPVQRRGTELSVKLGYGDTSVAYALAVHEHPSAHSPPTWEGKTIFEAGPGGRGSKYLERPMMQAIPGMDRRLAGRIVF